MSSLGVPVDGCTAAFLTGLGSEASDAAGDSAARQAAAAHRRLMRVVVMTILCFGRVSRKDAKTPRQTKK